VDCRTTAHPTRLRLATYHLYYAHLLWPFFNTNWQLLNDLFRCVTRGGLDIKHSTWRQLFFKKK